MIGNTIPCPKNEEELESLLSEPSERLVEFFRHMKGRRLVILGIGGKIGVTLGMAAARAARYAGSSIEIVGISRFSDLAARQKLEHVGLKTIACDLLDPESAEALLEADFVIFMAGRKFGTTSEESLTWAMNTVVPAHVAQHYRKARIIVFSTGCVYPLVTAETGGCVEQCIPAPIGDYAQSALARERIFEYYSKKFGTEVALFRLNYAIDLRYGVLHDIARQVWEEKPIDLSVRNFNCIWQGDVIERALLALEFCASPAFIINISGPETASVRAAAESFAEKFGKRAIFTNEDASQKPVYLCNASRSFGIFGYPHVSLSQMIDLTAAWIEQGGSSLDKPTHFQTTDGVF